MGKNPNTKNVDSPRQDRNLMTADKEVDVENKDVVDAAETSEGGEEETGKPEADETSEADSESGEEQDFSKFEPEVRKRPIDHIRERQESRTKAPNADDETNSSDEEELTPGARRLIEKQLSETLGPITKTISDEWNDREIQGFVLENPDFKKYAPLVRKYMNTPGYEGVPAKVIFHHLDYEYSKVRGAEEANAEIQKSRRAKSGGNSPRPNLQKGSGKLSAEDIFKLDEKEKLALDRRLAKGESIQT